MAEIVFIVFVFLYLVVSAKLESWKTISALGFKMETPLAFHQGSKIYDIFRTILFIIALTMCFVMTSIPWYVGLITLGVVWLCAGSIGRNIGINRYRNMWIERIEFVNTPEEKAQCEEMANMTDKELKEHARLLSVND